MARKSSGGVDDFDPYHKWLGIPKDQRPPTLYQLLGISPNETDIEVIASAAARQQTFVTQFQGGPNHDAAATILLELEKAKTTLLNGAKRRKYDQKLRESSRQRRRSSEGTDVLFGSGSQSVGEDNSITRQFAAIVAILGVAFAVMALFSFKVLPWNKQPDQPEQQPMNLAVQPAPAVQLPAVGQQPPAVKKDPLQVEVRTAEVTFELTPHDASVSVTPNQGVQEVTDRVGRKIVVKPADAGTEYAIAFESPGYQKTIRQLNLKPGQTERLNVVMERLPSVDSPPSLTELGKKLTGTKWTNANGAHFEWSADGRFLHNATYREWRVLDGRKIQIVLGPEHVDLLEFDDSLSKFKQLVKGGPLSIEGTRTWTSGSPSASIQQTTGPPTPNDQLITLLQENSLEGWQPFPWADNPQWAVSNRTLKRIGPGPSLMTKDKFKNFDLHLEFSLPPKGNSGVYLRGRYEVQLLDTAWRSGAGKPERPEGQCGAIYGLIAPRTVSYKGPNKWNALDIRLVGRNVFVRMNNVMLIENKPIPRVTPGGVDQNEADEGPLLLQAHSSPGAEFRNIQIRRIP